MTGDEIPCSGFYLAGAFVSAIALDTDQVGGMRIVGGIGFDADEARGALGYKAIGGLNLGKRGEVPSNF